MWGKMKVLKEEKVSLQGWSLFSNIERPHAAIIMRDPLDAVIKGVRYQVVPVETQTNDIAHKFLFETWSYKARGAIEHQNFMSFLLKNRQKYDTKIVRYVQDLKILNRHGNRDEKYSLETLKCAACIIDHINFNEHFDVYHMLQSFGLIGQEEFLSISLSTAESEKISSF